MSESPTEPRQDSPARQEQRQLSGQSSLSICCSSRQDGSGEHYFWNFETLSRNSIPCSTNHFHCHMSIFRGPGKPESSCRGEFQKYSNSRLNDCTRKVPKFEEPLAVSRQPSAVSHQPSADAPWRQRNECRYNRKGSLLGQSNRGCRAIARRQTAGGRAFRLRVSDLATEGTEGTEEEMRPRRRMEANGR